MNVFVNGEFGVVRYIGATSFAEGVWLGVELRRPSELYSWLCVCMYNALSLHAP